jgi:hypothetical protein
MGEAPSRGAEEGRGGKAGGPPARDVGTFRITLHVAVGVATRQRGEELPDTSLLIRGAQYDSGV